MTKIIKITSFCVAILIVIGVAVYVCVTSLWFLASLLPPGSAASVASVIDDSLVGSALLQAQPKILQSELNGINPSLFSKVALSKKNDSLYFAGLVDLPWHVSDAKQNLEINRWEVTTYGNIVLAKSARAAGFPSAKVRLSSIYHTFSETKQAGNPFSARAMVHVTKGSWPLVDKDYKAVIYHTREGIKIHSIFGERGVTSLEPITINKIIIDPEEIKIALPSKLLAHVPQQLQNTIFTTIMNKLSITHTQSLIKSVLGHASYVAAEVSTEGTAFLIRGNSIVLIKEVEKIIEQEEGYDHPQKRAIRLPDGTIGFELQPGNIEAAWSKTNDCEHLQGVKRQWWVCSNSTSVVVGSTQEKSSMLLNEEINNENNWDIVIGHINLGSKGRIALIAKGNNEQAIIEIK